MEHCLGLCHRRAFLPEAIASGFGETIVAADGVYVLLVPQLVLVVIYPAFRCVVTLGDSKRMKVCTD